MYKTKDFYFATVLKALGYKIESYDRNGKVFDFIFDLKEDDAKTIYTSYINDELIVKAKSFTESINLLKTIVNS